MTDDELDAIGCAVMRAAKRITRGTNVATICINIDATKGVMTTTTDLASRDLVLQMLKAAIDAMNVEPTLHDAFPN